MNGLRQPRQATRGTCPATGIDEQQAGMLSGIQRRVVHDVLGDEDAPMLAGVTDERGVVAADQVGKLDDSDDVVADSAQMLGKPPRVHLVQQQFHCAGPARICCCRCQAASRSSAACALAAMRSSISAPYSAY